MEASMYLKRGARVAAHDLARGRAVAGAPSALPGPLPIPGSQHRRILPSCQRTPRLLPAKDEHVMPCSVLEVPHSPDLIS